MSKNNFEINSLVSEPLQVKPLEEGQFASYKLCDADMVDISRVDDKTGKPGNCQPRRSMLRQIEITDPYNNFQQITIQNVISRKPVELPGGEQIMKPITARVNFPFGGVLTLTANHNGTYAFLERHPRNRDNPFRDRSKTPVFYRINSKKKAISDMENEYILIDALSHIKGADEVELRAIYTKLDETSRKAITTTLGFEVLKRDIFALAKKFPVLVMKASSNKVAKMKIQIMDAEYFNNIQFLEDEEDVKVPRRWVMVNEEKKQICTVDLMTNKYDGLMDFFLSGSEGNQAYLEMVAVLKKVTSPKSLPKQQV